MLFLKPQVVSGNKGDTKVPNIETLNKRAR